MYCAGGGAVSDSGADIFKSRISYIRYLSGVVDEISKGNLHTQIDKKGYDELTTIAESIDDMQHNLDKMMKEERENERKTES